jgi:acyl dehydratase
MTIVDDASELSALVGTELGLSAWRTLQFEEFVAFGTISGDLHWIHTDRERAKRETPFGDAIAQGFFTLSLVTAMAAECLEIRHKDRSLNYGVDRVRFTNAVKPGDRVRLRLTLGGFTPMEPGVNRLTLSCLLEIDGKEKPALVADWLSVVYDRKPEEKA